MTDLKDLLAQPLVETAPLNAEQQRTVDEHMARRRAYEAGKSDALALITDQEAALKLANLLSIYDNDAARGEALVEERVKVINILSRITG